MIELSPNISEQDRKEVERRIAALDKPARKKAVNQGFNKPECYGMTFYPHVLVYPDTSWGDRKDRYGKLIYAHTYAERQEAIYNYVMSEMGGQL